MKGYLLAGIASFACVAATGAAMAQDTPETPVAADAGQAGAAQPSGGIQDIIVTARRRAENVQNVPVAISAIGGADLAKNGIVETSDLSGRVPNLQVYSAYGTALPSFSLRGISVGNEYASNSASPIGVYVDEVYQTYRASHGQQLYDLERVEVLRGPQGTLYGRNTTGGAINFITQKPSLHGNKGYLTAGYGRFDRVSLEGAVETTLVEDELGLRIAGTYVNSSPYIRNLIGRDPGGVENYGLRGTLLWRFAGGEVTLKGYIARSNGAQEAASFDTNATPSGRGPIVLGPLGAAFGLVYDRSNLNNRTVELNGVGDQTIHAQGVVLTARFDLSDQLQFTSITGYDSGLSNIGPTEDCDGTPLDICAYAFGPTRFRALNQELRLNYDSDQLKLIGGLYYGGDLIKVRANQNVFGILSDIRDSLGLPPTYFNPGGLLDPTALPTPIKGPLRFNQRGRSYAAFGEAVYNFTERLSLTAGVRYTRDRIRYINGTSTLNDDTGTPRLVVISEDPNPVPAGPNVVPLNFRGGSSALTGRAIVSYKPADDAMLYVSYSRGYRAGTFNGNAVQTRAQVYFVPPEKVNTYEAGLKLRAFNNQVQLNTALYYNDYSGQQVQELTANAISFLRSVNGVSKGIEVEFEYRPTQALTITASGGYLDTRYDKGQSLSGISVAGNRFPFASKWSFNGGIDYRIPAGSGEVLIHADTSYVGRYYYDVFNDRQATGPFRLGGGDYWLVNGRLSYNTGPWSLAVWGKNLTNKLYFPFALNTEASFGTDTYYRATPRTFGAELSFRF